jgi:hypothetical protein
MRALMLGVMFSAVLAGSAFACGPGSTSRAAYNPPAAGSAIEFRLKDAKISPEDRAKVELYRDAIARLVKAKQDSEARDAEDKAMLILGFRKLYMACGTGSFMWVPKDFGLGRQTS